MPSKNDVSLCIECSGLALFNEDLTLRAPTLDELLKMKTSGDWKEITLQRRALEMARSSRKPNA
jgi:hypothetical protein